MILCDGILNRPRVRSIEVVFKELKMETSTQLTCEGKKKQQFMAGASLGLGVLAKPLALSVPQSPSCRMGRLCPPPKLQGPN